MHLGSLNSRPRQEKSQKRERKDGAYEAFKKAEEKKKKGTKTGGTRVERVAIGPERCVGLRRQRSDLGGP